ncbi:hypothetical protein FKP32DRAFT_1377926 [Trametes sanguinea]|nr:hypothetical protein FKP32DRAFT_1377926 [Trametes sanguinea]
MPIWCLSLAGLSPLHSAALLILRAIDPRYPRNVALIVVVFAARTNHSITAVPCLIGSGCSGCHMHQIRRHGEVERVAAAYNTRALSVDGAMGT